MEIKSFLIKTTLKLISLNSPEKYKVGAIYVQGLKWSIGWNKSAAYGMHAEDTAIRRFRKKYKIEPIGGKMYCTLSPCTNCTKTVRKHKMVSVYTTKYTGKL